ncbi:MAG: hypothetical protein N2657_06350, partial [bacterium]|nr:hypothetical protein [bacterium]
MRVIIILTICFIYISITVSAFSYKEYDIYNISDNTVETKNFYIPGFANSSPVILGIAPIVDIN